MATPIKAEIRKLATELFMKQQLKDDDAISDTLPEPEELVEGGFTDTAKSLLMSNKLENYEAQWKNYIAENLADFTVDVEECLKSGCYVSGTTGTGKSDIGMYTAKALMEKAVIVVVFDSTQDWQNRSSIANVQTLKVPFIVHIPVVSTVYDISLLSVLQRQRLIEGFCGDIYRNQAMKKPNERRQYFLIFEESHNYFKEGFMRAKRFSDSAMLLSEGRNYNVRFMCITQFASLLDKTAMKYMRQRYFGFTDEPNDTEYIARFFAKEDRDTIKETLRKMRNGEFLYAHGTNVQKIGIEPFGANISRIQIDQDVPKIEPIRPITTRPNYSIMKAITMSLLLLAAIAYGLSQMAGMM
jgi:hypothetical protein